MSDFRPLPSFQSSDADWAKEHFSGVSQAPPAVLTTPLSIFPEPDYTQDADQAAQPSLRAQTQPTSRTETSPKIITPVYDKVATQSLLDALQSTMTTTTARQPIVIPGAKKRLQAQAQMKSERRIHPHLRSIITLSSLLFFMLVALLWLSPLGENTGALPLINGVINWAIAQQQSWSITAHNIFQPNTQNTTDFPALPASQYIAIARADAISAGISPDYFVRQINVESSFNPKAVSPSGAVGIAQFIPSTAASLGVNPWDPISSLQGAARLMASQARQYNGDYAKALAAYNSGSGTVDYAVRAGGANWMNYLPYETRQYIRKIMGI